MPEDTTQSPQPQEHAPGVDEADDEAARRRLEEREARLVELRRLRDRLREETQQEEAEQ